MAEGGLAARLRPVVLLIWLVLAAQVSAPMRAGAQMAPDQANPASTPAEPAARPAVDAAPKTGIEFAKAARAAQDQGDLDTALKLYGRALAVNDLSAENKAIVYNNRGIVHWMRGETAQAIVDYDAALKLAPQYADALQNRGLAYAASGRTREAVADYGAALAILPEDAFAFENRGRALLYAGDYPGAIHDLTQALAFNPGDGYAVLWLHIARVRAGQDDSYEFRQNARSVDLAQWPGPLVSLFLGTTTIENLRVLVAAAPDRKTQTVWACEADFYAGILLREQKSEASGRQFLQEAMKYCAPSSIELTAAHAELRRSGP